jgi:hypothetical protein
VRVRLIGDAPARDVAAADKAPESPPVAKAPGEAIDRAAAETSIAKRVSAVTGEAARTPPTTAGAKIARTPPGRRAGQEPAAARTTPEARHWPEGASGLGAIAREPERELWWSLPPPWSPFGGN